MTEPTAIPTYWILSRYDLCAVRPPGGNPSDVQQVVLYADHVRVVEGMYSAAALLAVETQAAMLREENAALMESHFRVATAQAERNEIGQQLEELHTNLAHKTKALIELSGKCLALEQRLATVEELRETLDQLQHQIDDWSEELGHVRGVTFGKVKELAEYQLVTAQAELATLRAQVRHTATHDADFDAMLALSTAKAEVWMSAAHKAVEMYAGIAASHSWFDLQGFLNYCEQQARLRVRKTP